MPNISFYRSAGNVLELAAQDEKLSKYKIEDLAFKFLHKIENGQFVVLYNDLGWPYACYNILFFSDELALLSSQGLDYMFSRGNNLALYDIVSPSIKISTLIRDVLLNHYEDSVFFVYYKSELNVRLFKFNTNNYYKSPFIRAAISKGDEAEITPRMVLDLSLDSIYKHELRLLLDINSGRINKDFSRLYKYIEECIEIFRVESRTLMEHPLSDIFYFNKRESETPFSFMEENGLTYSDLLVLPEEVEVRCENDIYNMCVIKLDIALEYIFLCFDKLALVSKKEIEEFRASCILDVNYTEKKIKNSFSKLISLSGDTYIYCPFDESLASCFRLVHEYFHSFLYYFSSKNKSRCEMRPLIHEFFAFYGEYLLLCVLKERSEFFSESENICNRNFNFYTQDYSLVLQKSLSNLPIEKVERYRMSYSISRVCSDIFSKRDEEDKLELLSALIKDSSFFDSSLLFYS